MFGCCMTEGMARNSRCEEGRIKEEIGAKIKRLEGNKRQGTLREIGGNADGERDVGRVGCMKRQKKDEGADQNTNRDSYRENRR